MKNDIVFTPEPVVGFMLDKAGYQGVGRILEPSFGNGVFLIEMIKRLIHRCETDGYSKEKISEIIKDSVFGIEIDEENYCEAMRRIEALLSHYSIPLRIDDLSNNLLCGDTLELYSTMKDFDFVVGNPPYIRIHDIPIEERERLKHFPFTEGTSDIYIVFFYIGMQCLKETGTLCYISPNSYLKNTSQKAFRNYLSDKVKFIYDFKSNQVFDDVNTYVCITGIGPGDFEYNSCKSLNEIEYTSHTIPKDTWIFASDEDTDFLNEVSERPVALSDIFSVQNGFATNRDSVFISKCANSDEDTVIFNGHRIEKGCVHSVVKGSRCDAADMLMLFPYENGFPDMYPLAYHYLSLHKEDLMKRDLDTKTKWYEFGRRQGFQQVGAKKLTFKHVMDKNCDNVFLRVLQEDMFVYSGICVIERDISINHAASILSSPDFLKYCKLVGKDLANGYFSVSAKQVAQYRIPFLPSFSTL